MSIKHKFLKGCEVFDKEIIAPRTFKSVLRFLFVLFLLSLFIVFILDVGIFEIVFSIIKSIGTAFLPVITIYIMWVQYQTKRFDRLRKKDDYEFEFRQSESNKNYIAFYLYLWRGKRSRIIKMHYNDGRKREPIKKDIRVEPYDMSAKKENPTHIRISNDIVRTADKISFEDEDGRKFIIDSAMRLAAQRYIHTLKK